MSPQAPSPSPRHSGVMVPEDIGGLPSTPPFCGPPQPGTVLHSSGRHPVMSPTVEWSRTKSGASVSIASARFQKEQEAWDYAHQLRDQRISGEWSEHYKQYYANISAKLKYDKIQLQNQLDGMNKKTTELEEATVALQTQLEQSGQKSKNRLGTNFRLAAALGEQMQKTQTLDEEKKAGDARIKALGLEKNNAEKEYTNDLRNKQREVDEGGRRAKKLEADLQEAKQTKKDLLEEYTKEREANTRLNAELKAAEQKRCTAEENLRCEEALRRSRVEVLEGVVLQHKTAIDNHKQSNANLEAQAAKDAKTAKEQDCKLRTAKSDLAAAEAQVASCKDQLHMGKERSKELQRQLDTSMDNVGKLNEALDEQKEQLHECQSTLDIIHRTADRSRPSNVNSKINGLDSPTSPPNEQAPCSTNTMTKNINVDQANATTKHKELTPPKTPHLSQTRPAFSSSAFSPTPPAPAPPAPHSTPHPLPPRPSSPPAPTSSGASERRKRMSQALPEVDQQLLTYDILPKVLKKPGTGISTPTGPKATTSQKRRTSSDNETFAKRRRGVCYRS